MFNYVKAHRKRLGLSQNELGYLLGFDGHTSVSRIEQGKQDPLLRDMIALECLFEKAASRIFPESYAKITSQLIRRIDLFDGHLKEEPETQSNMLKLQALRDIRKRVSAVNDARL